MGGERRVSRDRPTKCMLRATRSFEYDDPYTGRQSVVAGKTHVIDNHWLVAAYPDAWTVSDRPDLGELDSIPHTDGRPAA